MSPHDPTVNDLFEHFAEIRYVSIYKDGILTSKQRSMLANTSSADTDRYEELLVNPVILTATRQRGNIDCEGLNFIIIAYGSFFQLIKEIHGGHISICLDKQTDITSAPGKIFDFLKSVLFSTN
ncbi:MAG: hypothetical protein C5B59_13445 [Bacteroidetes bacterium]|nr:MAG: hypothetical protein C5B59_13445 [Bacteroidota bacterium]